VYDKDLSEIFDRQGYDKEKYPWNFKKSSNTIKPTKIFYSIGDSWLFSKYFVRTFLNKYQDYLLINKAMEGMSNSLIINTLQNDLDLLLKNKVDITFLVSFSEVGRTTKDLAFVGPKDYKSTHDFFGATLKEQYKKIYNTVKDYPHYITTGFISNNFNSNKSIADFCGGSTTNKPQDVFTVYSNGIFEFLRDRKTLFDFNFAEDVQKSLQLKEYLEGSEYVDETLHPDHYKPYELFLNEVFSNLHKNER